MERKIVTNGRNQIHKGNVKLESKKEKRKSMAQETKWAIIQKACKEEEEEDQVFFK